MKMYQAIVNWKVMTLMVIFIAILFVVTTDHIGKYFERGNLESVPSRAILIEDDVPSDSSKEEVVDNDRTAFKVITAKITAYCLTGTMANGEGVYEGAVACPMDYELGTRLKIGDVTGYTCTDRMHRKYRDKDYEYFIEERWDIWFSDCSDAWSWGIRIINIEVYE